MPTRSLCPALIVAAAVLAVCAVSLIADEPAARKSAAQALAETVDETVSAIRDANRTDQFDASELYVMNLATGETTLVAHDPDPRLSIAAPDWSPDGKQIVFEILEGRNWRRSQIASLNITAPNVKFRRLGRGHSPSFSPQGKRIAFLIGPGADNNEAPGIWTMLTDGVRRQRFGIFGRPRSSPDGLWLLVSSHTSPLKVSLVDSHSGEEFPLGVADQKFLTRPNWAGNGRTVVAVVGYVNESSLEILDASDPDNVQQKLTLLSHDQCGDWMLSDPVYEARSRRCFVVGTTPQGRALLAVDAARPGKIERLEADLFDEKLHDLALSPDDRYLLFCSNRVPRSHLLYRRR